MQFVEHVLLQQIVMNGQEQLVLVDLVFIHAQLMKIVLNRYQFVEQQHTEHPQPVACVLLQRQDSCVRQIGQELFATLEQVLVFFLLVSQTKIVANSILFA